MGSKLVKPANYSLKEKERTRGVMDADAYINSILVQGFDDIIKLKDEIPADKKQEIFDLLEVDDNVTVDDVVSNLAIMDDD